MRSLDNEKLAGRMRHGITSASVERNMQDSEGTQESKLPIVPLTLEPDPIPWTLS